MATRRGILALLASAFGLAAAPAVAAPVVRLTVYTRSGVSRARWLARFSAAWIDDERGREIGHTIPLHYHGALAHSYIAGEPERPAVRANGVGLDGDRARDRATSDEARRAIEQVVRIVDGTPDPLESTR